MSRRPRSRFVARGNGTAYTPRHWNGQVISATVPGPWESRAAQAALIIGGTCLALVLAAVAVLIILSGPVY